MAGGGSCALWFVGDGEGRSSPWLVVVACEWVCHRGRSSTELGGGALLAIDGMVL